MTEQKSVLLISEMRRHDWIAYCWEDVTEVGDAERKYLRLLHRPIEQAVEAAKQWDTWVRAQVDCNQLRGKEK